MHGGVEDDQHRLAQSFRLLVRLRWMHVPHSCWVLIVVAVISADSRHQSPGPDPPGMQALQEPEKTQHV